MIFIQMISKNISNTFKGFHINTVYLSNNNLINLQGNIRKKKNSEFTKYNVSIMISLQTSRGI